MQTTSIKRKQSYLQLLRAVVWLVHSVSISQLFQQVLVGDGRVRCVTQGHQLKQHHTKWPPDKYANIQQLQWFISQYNYNIYIFMNHMRQKRTFINQGSKIVGHHDPLILTYLVKCQKNVWNGAKTPLCFTNEYVTYFMLPSAAPSWVYQNKKSTES